MLKFNHTLILVLIVATSPKMMARQSAGIDLSPTTYLLPNGRVFQISKWDSLEKAWGKGRITFRHNEEDDKRSIIHLVQITDQMKHKNEEEKRRTESSFGAMLNNPAPDFELTDIQGKRWSLKELRGKIVVLNFWFTSCAPCIQELPVLNTLAYMYGSGTAVFLALTFNDAAKVEGFLKKRRFDYMLLPNSEKVDKRYNISTWPTSMVIDQQGYIRKIIQSSPRIREELVSAIEMAKEPK